MPDFTTAEKLLLSLSLVAALSGVRLLLIRLIRKESLFISQEQRRWMAQAKNWVFVLILLGLVVVWGAELRQFMLSITAFTIALVVATKELILCLSGSLLKTGSGAFSAGDWIEIGDVRGEVIDQNALSTTIQEIHGGNRYDYTGRTITVPNSVFLTSNVKNLNFIRRYVFHSFTVTLPLGSPIAELEGLILERWGHYSAAFIDVARRYNQVIEKRAGIDIPGPDPRIWVATGNDGRVVITTTIFCPTGEAVAIEQRLIRDLLARVRKDSSAATAAADRGTGDEQSPIPVG